VTVQLSDLPEAIRRQVRRNPNLIPLAVERFGPNGEPTGGIDVKWRAVPNVEHGTLCRAFGLDPVTHWFDVSESFRAIGSQRVGAGRTPSGRREISGFVMRGPRGGNPVAKIWVVTEGQRFRDRDPTSRADFERLGEM
jgi:hypothetical protein